MNNWSDALQTLPALAPPDERLGRGWAELQTRRRVQRYRPAAYTGLALAASVLLASAVLLPPFTGGGWEGGRAVSDSPPPQPSPVYGGGSQVAGLIEQSHQLEQTLADVRPQARYWNSELATEAVALTDDLALVDLQLNYADDAGAARLWQNRVALMSQLVQTHEQAAARRTSPVNPEEISL